MKVTPTELPEVLLLEPKVFGDERGFFFESYNRRALAELGLDAEVFPISARRGTGMPELVAHLAALMPAGPFLFAVGASSDQSLELLLAAMLPETRTPRPLP